MTKTMQNNPIKLLLSELPQDNTSIILTEDLRNKLLECMRLFTPTDSSIDVSSLLNYLVDKKLVAITNLVVHREQITIINSLIHDN